LFSTILRRVMRTSSRSVHLPKSNMRMSYRSLSSTKIPPVSKKALPWLSVSLAGTALLGGFSLFRENRVLTASLLSSLEEKDSDVVNLKENKHSKSHSWNMPLTMPYFVGRQELSDLIIERLEQAMQDSNSNHPPIVLSGMGGIGKTQLAIHCLHRIQTASAVNCFRFEAETPDRLDAAYRSFYMEIVRKPSEEIVKNVQVTMEVGDVKAGRDAIIGGVVIQQPELTPDDVRSIVKAWFTNHPDCILVYDNVKDYESIQKFLPKSGGQVMILTRRADWPANFTVHCLSGLKRVDSVKLLIELGQIKGEDKSVAELANKLEDLPLALAQAGAYMRYNKETAESYLKLYSKYRGEMLAESTMPAGIAHVPVMVTWEMSLKEIDQQDASGTIRTLFTLCAYGAPEGTLKILLQHYLEEKNVPEPELKVNDAIQRLKNYSLLEVSEDGKKLVVHRLIQEVTRIHHENERMLRRDDLITWYTPWLVITEKQFDFLDSDKESIDYLTQALTVLKHQERLFPEEENNKNLILANLKKRAGAVLFYQGFYYSAKEQFEYALKIQKNCNGLEHISIAGTLNDLAVSYGNLGSVKKECDLLEHALRIIEAHYGKNHIKLTKVLGNLGNAYAALGNYTMGRECLERTLKIEEMHYGKDHIEVATTLVNLGDDYGLSGDYIKMRNYTERGFKIMESYYGEEHVNVAIALSRLGIAYGFLGDHKKACEYLERALKIEETHYGKDHIKVAKTFNELGIAYDSVGDHKKAREYLEDALKMKEAYYGKDHIEVANPLISLGIVYRSLGNYKKGREYLEHALKIEEAHYGKDHVKVANTLINLGIIYHLLGDHKKVHEYLEYGLKNEEAYYGKNHIKLAKTLTNLGVVYGSLGDYKKAREYLERALKIGEAYYGKDHVNVDKTLISLGIVYGSLGDHKKARECLEHALKIDETHYGKDHVKIANTLIKLGIAYGALGKDKRQREVLERALKIFMNSPYYGKNHPDTQAIIRQLSSMSLVAQALQRLFAPAKKYYPINEKPAYEAKPDIKPNGR